MRYSIGQAMTDINLKVNKFERFTGQREAQLEASRREWNEERDLWTERCCRLESEKQALQDAVERREEEKKQLAIDYERKLRDKDNEISKLMTRTKLSLPTIRQIPADPDVIIFIVNSCLLSIMGLLLYLLSSKSLFVLHCYRQN